VASISEDNRIPGIVDSNWKITPYCQKLRVVERMDLEVSQIMGVPLHEVDRVHVHRKLRRIIRIAR